MAWRWPWSTPPPRTGDATDLVARILADVAAGSKTPPAAERASAVGAARQLYADAFASARVESDTGVVAAALTPAVLASAGRGVVRGEWTAIVSTAPALRILPVSIIEERGTPTDPRYRVQLHGGDVDDERGPFPRGDLLHVTYRPSEGGGDRGVPAWADTHAAASLAALERVIGSESQGGVGWTYATTRVQREGNDPAGQYGAGGGQSGRGVLRDELATRLAESEGDVSALPTQSEMFGRSGEAGVPAQRDVRVLRYGPEFDASYAPLVDALRLGVGMACGIPSALLSSTSSSNAYREAYRAFEQGPVVAAARLFEAEVLRLTGAVVTLTFTEPVPADLASRGRLVRSLTESGVEVDRALQLAGLDA